MQFFFRPLRWAVAVITLLVITVLGFVAYDKQQGPPLEPWHTFVPRELDIKALDQADWSDYLRAEDEIFTSLRTEVSQKLEPGSWVPYNRYFSESPVNPARFAQDWNRSFVLEPSGDTVGAVVLLHGLTDSPYSGRHIARAYAEAGFVALGIRLPGHGTVPGGLTKVDWESWSAATRLAVREASKRVGEKPLHIVGYSNGGALAVKYVLDTIDDEQLPRVDRVVLISPMIGVTRFARFAGLAGLPAIFPAFAKSAWLGNQPEFNPFKYNSFPVNGARQSHRLSTALQAQIVRLSETKALGALPPMLTFQSVVDNTVSTPAVISALYEYLPANGSELVLFDVNRNVKFEPLLRANSANALEQMMPERPSRFTLTVIANESVGSSEMLVRSIAAGQATERSRPLGIAYPAEIFSLSHVALPFPPEDGLYGLTPDPNDNFGVSLGNLVARGERGALMMNLDTIFRVNSNPFFPFMLSRITENLLEAPKAPPTSTEENIAPGRSARASTRKQDLDRFFASGSNGDASYP